MDALVSVISVVTGSAAKGDGAGMSHRPQWIVGCQCLCQAVNTVPGLQLTFYDALLTFMYATGYMFTL